MLLAATAEESVWRPRHLSRETGQKNASQTLAEPQNPNVPPLACLRVSLGSVSILQPLVMIMWQAAQSQGTRQVRLD